MKFSFFLIGSVLCSSCAVVYFPNTRNAPMFSGKGELQASITTGLGNNLQTAYALTEHVGVMANAMDVHNEYYGQHNYGEIGLGYYQNMKMTDRSLYFDFFGGYGTGNLDVYIDGGSKTLVNHEWVQGPYQKFFLQPGLAVKLSQSRVRFYLGMVYRLSFIDISRLSGMSGFQLSSATPITFTKPQLFFHEPAFVFKAVSKKLFLTCQAGLNLTFEKTDNLFNYNPLQLSVGVGILLNLKRKKN